MNRTKAPEIKSIDTINLVEVEKTALDNGIPVFFINTGSQDVIRTDFIFDAGSWQQEKFFQAALANNLLREGTKKYSSEKIARQFDYFGTFYGSETSRNSASVSFYSLHKFYEQSSQIIEEIIKNPIYPPKEFELKINQKKQQFQLERQKVETLALIKYFELLFGKLNPYGNSPALADFNSLSHSDLVHYHKNYYHSKNTYILMAGKEPEKFIATLNRRFGQKDWEEPLINFSTELITQTSKPGTHLVEKKAAKQSAIRAGFILPQNITDKEYYHLLIFNTIYGGFFGSRLMQNLREDKGYTYGVSSFIREEKLASYFMIATNVGRQYTNAAIEEIKKELQQLLEKGFSEAELDIARKQMTGDFLTLFDGAFAQIDAFNNVYELGKTYTYYKELFKQVKTATTKEILHSARKFFSIDKLLIAVAGNRE